MTPVTMPSATPRGTDRRVKRHSAGARTRCATGRRTRLCSNVSRLGRLRDIHPLIRAQSPISAPIAEEPALLALPVPFLDGVALVMRLLALRQREFDLCPPPAIEIDR